MVFTRAHLEHGSRDTHSHSPHETLHRNTRSFNYTADGRNEQKFVRSKPSTGKVCNRETRLGKIGETMGYTGGNMGSSEQKRVENIFPRYVQLIREGGTSVVVLDVPLQASASCHHSLALLRSSLRTPDFRVKAAAAKNTRYLSDRRRFARSE